MKETARVSRGLLSAIKLAGKPAFKIAWQAGIHPNTLSKIVHGHVRVRRNDPRVLRVAKLLGVPATEAFE